MSLKIVFFSLLLTGSLALQIKMPNDSERFAVGKVISGAPKIPNDLVRAIEMQREQINKECTGRKTPTKGRLQGPIFNVHITHHAGRMLQGMAKKNNRTMNWVGVANALRNGNHTEVDKFWEHGTWNDFEEHFGFPGKVQYSLNDLGCQEKDVVLTTMIRHPMHRVLHFDLRSESGQDGCETDNYALRWYLGFMCEGPCCGGGFSGVDKCAPLGREHLQLAKERVKKFDLIFVLEHLEESSKLLCSRLGFSDCDLKTGETTHMATSRARADSFLKRNALDIELYEFMKQRAFDMLVSEGHPVPSKEQQAAMLNFNSNITDFKDETKRFDATSSRRTYSSSAMKWKCR